MLHMSAQTLRSFVTAKFGSAENAFNAMDKAKSNSGRLSERDFLEECQKLLGGTFWS